jgi:signal transduction histidine kinase
LRSRSSGRYSLSPNAFNLSLKATEFHNVTAECSLGRSDPHPAVRSPHVDTGRGHTVVTNDDPRTVRMTEFDEGPGTATADALLMNEVLHSLTDNVAVITRDGTIVAVNDAWREFGKRNGAPLAVIEGVGLNHLTATLTSDTDHPSQLMVGIESVLSGVAATYELDYPCDSPQEARWFRMAITRLRNTNERFVVIHRDVTRQIQAERERARAESLLSHAARMESAERIAGGVAHEFNNMLGVILGHAEHALDNDAVRLDRVDDVVQIQRAAQRSALLVRHLLTFARRQMVEPCTVDVNGFVASQLEALQRRLGLRITLTFTPSEEECVVRIDPAQLELVLTNLCLNSSEALADEGWIHISTTRDSFREDEPDGPNTDYVRLSVTDNGSGIAPDALPLVFDPFYTTKASDEHAGLGLATIHGAIAQVDGFVEVDSSRTTGTRVDVWIPCAVGDSVTPTVPDASVRHRAPLPHAVLVVDDEQLMLDMTARILRRAGWTVLTASSAEAALEMVLTAGIEFDLLLTDVVMPGMDGPTLVQTLAESGCTQPHVYMSGYTASALGDVAYDSRFFISKPFTGKALTDKIRAMLVEIV